MRIVWDNEQSRFVAELTPGEQWRDDKDAVQSAGFRTDGPPSWVWFATKAATLNKLRDLKPKSGITLTEVALAQYQTINQREEQKVALKKQFQTAQKIAKKSEKLCELDIYFDEEIGVNCVVVEPKSSVYVMLKTYENPDAICISCGDPLYGPWDYPDICLWCDKIKLDKNPEL